MFILLVGAWMASRQSLYISTGKTLAGVERSFNWWGLGIAAGLLVGGLGGVVGVLTRRQVVLVVSALVSMLSGFWHPLLWPAVIAAVPVLLLGASSLGEAHGNGSASPPAPSTPL